MNAQGSGSGRSNPRARSQVRAFKGDHHEKLGRNPLPPPGATVRI